MTNLTHPYIEDLYSHDVMTDLRFDEPFVITYGLGFKQRISLSILEDGTLEVMSGCQIQIIPKATNHIWIKPNP